MPPRICGRRGREGVGGGRDVVADQVGHRPGRALVGDVLHVEPGLLQPGLGHEMAVRAGAGRAVAQLLALAGADDLLEFLDGFRLHGRMHHEDDRRPAEQGDVAEILDRVIADIRIDGRRDDMRGDPRHAERVAVGGGAGHLRRAEHAAGAGPVLDHELLLERFRELLGGDPPERVGAAARRVGHDDADRLRRPVLRAGASGPQRERAKRRGDRSQHDPHGCPSVF